VDDFYFAHCRLVSLVNIIMGITEPDDIQLLAADLNSDGIVDIRDIVLLVNLILE